jgi:PTH1 family peptidyl-tRNA hydrolase
VALRRLIVGLGNPGAEYEWTRHNLGFMLVDLLAHQTGALIKRRECRALVGQTQIDGETVELVKPQTYMNVSGESVACLLAKRSLDSTGSLIVVSDDIALPFGAIRLRARGSAGGHNGLRSIIGAISTTEFIRLRIGIQPAHPVGDLANYVLDEFPRSERAEVTKVVERAAEALRSVLKDGIEKAMAQYN